MSKIPQLLSQKLSSGYPGISINVEYIVLRAWLENMHSGVQIACEQYTKNELSMFSDDADYSEYRHAFDIAGEEIPRVVNSAFVVTVFALYESSMKKLLDFCGKNEGTTLFTSYKPNSKLGSLSFIEKQVRYIVEVLKFEYALQAEIGEQLQSVCYIRNVLAHGGASLLEDTYMFGKREDRLSKIVDSSRGELILSVGQLTVSSEYLMYSFELLEGELNRFMDHIEKRYFFTRE